MPIAAKPSTSQRKLSATAAKVDNDGRDQYFVHSVDNALLLLEALCNTDQDNHLSQLSAQTGLNKSKVFRLLMTFQQRGYVEQEAGSHRYRLSLRAFETARKCLLKMPLLDKVQPDLDRLAKQTGESIYLAVRHGEEILLLELADPAQQVKVTSMLGRRFPLEGTAAGKVFRACDKQAPGNDLPMAEAAAIRRGGYALLENDLAGGVTSLAVPLYDYQRRVPGVLLMVAPDFRLSDSRLRTEQIDRLLAAGESISTKFGYFPEFSHAQGI